MTGTLVLLLLLQATYWKQQTSQLSLSLNNLRMLLKFLQNPGFQMEYLYH